MQTTKALKRIAVAGLALTALMGIGGGPANAPAPTGTGQVSTSYEGAYIAPDLATDLDYPISYEFADLDEALEYCSWVEGEELNFDCMVAAFMVYDRHEIQA